MCVPVMRIGGIRNSVNRAEVRRKLSVHSSDFHLPFLVELAFAACSFSLGNELILNVRVKRVIFEFT